MKRGRRTVGGLAAGAFGLLLAAGSAEAGKPNIMDSCKICHTAADGVVRGKMVSVSPEFKSVSLTVGPLVWIVKYGDDLKVRLGEKFGGPEALKEIPRDREIAVTFTGSENTQEIPRLTRAPNLLTK